MDDDDSTRFMTGLVAAVCFGLALLIVVWLIA